MDWNMLLDEATRASWTNSKEEGQLLAPLAEQKMRQLAEHPDEAMPVLLQALEESHSLRQATTFAVIRFIGYPKNTDALPYLFSFVGDANFPGWLDVAGTLQEIEPTNLVPHMIRLLLKQMPLLPFGGGDHSWREIVEGCCAFLCLDGTVPTYALGCCPTINLLLCQEVSASSLFLDSLLDVIEKAGNTVEYVLPALILVALKQTASHLGRHARRLIFTFSSEALAPYQLLLAGLSDSSASGE